MPLTENQEKTLRIIVNYPNVNQAYEDISNKDNLPLKREYVYQLIKENYEFSNEYHKRRKEYLDDKIVSYNSVLHYTVLSKLLEKVKANKVTDRVMVDILKATGSFEYEKGKDTFKKAEDLLKKVEERFSNAQPIR